MTHFLFTQLYGLNHFSKSFGHHLGYDDHFCDFSKSFGHHRGYDDHFQDFSKNFGHHRNCLGIVDLNFR